MENRETATGPDDCLGRKTHWVLRSPRTIVSSGIQFTAKEVFTVLLILPSEIVVTKV